jgi:hypothetical protein
MFALRLTVFDIMCSRRCSDRSLDMLREHELVNGENQVRSLVGALTARAEQAAERAEALLLNAFAPPPPGRDPVRDRRACVVCFDNFWAHEGLECDASASFCVQSVRLAGSRP